MTTKASGALSGLAALAAAGALAACGPAAGGSGYGGARQAGAGQAPRPASRGPVVAARKLTGIGTVLTDRSGRTIYSPAQEAHGTILCTGSCLGFWFPVTVAPGAKLRAPAGVSGTFGTIMRPDDGMTQLTYNGRPLYTFRLDQAPGQSHGNDFSDHFGSRSFTWHAVTASGRAPAHDAKPGPKPSGGYPGPSGSSPGYGG